MNKPVLNYWIKKKKNAFLENFFCGLTRTKKDKKMFKIEQTREKKLNDERKKKA